MKSRIVVTTAILLLFANVQAGAESLKDKDTAKLITPTLWARHIPDATNDGTLNDGMLACNLTNVGNKVRTVQVRIISDGVVLLDSGEVSVTPQYTANYFVDGFPNGAPIYCEFTVEGSKNDYRGAAKLFHYPNSSDFAVIAAE
jgi:hypothetical protein